MWFKTVLSPVISILVKFQRVPTTVHLASPCQVLLFIHTWLRKQNPPSQAQQHSSSLFEFFPSRQPHSQAMESFEDISEYQNYWEMTSMFLNDELKRYTPFHICFFSIDIPCPIFSFFFFTLVFNLRTKVWFWDSWAMDQASSHYYDSSSPDEAASAIASKNTVSERNRRKKLNDKLLELRQAVPKISKVIYRSLIMTSH